MHVAFSAITHVVFIVLKNIAWGAAALLAADFISGLIHWAEDTWTAPGRSALLDRWIVVDNIEHHRRPGSIREGNYWATNRVAIFGAAAGMLGIAALHVSAWPAYLIALLASQSNQVHKWAHSSHRPLPVRVLQAIGVLQPRKHHGVHHMSPYVKRFCAYTNFLNPLLDGIGFWRGLEWAIRRCGITLQRGGASRGGY